MRRGPTDPLCSQTLCTSDPPGLGSSLPVLRSSPSPPPGAANPSKLPRLSTTSPKQTTDKNPANTEAHTKTETSASLSEPPICRAGRLGAPIRAPCPVAGPVLSLSLLPPPVPEPVTEGLAAPCLERSCPGRAGRRPGSPIPEACGRLVASIPGHGPAGHPQWGLLMSPTSWTRGRHTGPQATQEAAGASGCGTTRLRQEQHTRRTRGRTRGHGSSPATGHARSRGAGQRCLGRQNLPSTAELSFMTP